MSTNNKIHQTWVNIWLPKAPKLKQGKIKKNCWRIELVMFANRYWKFKL